MTVGSGVGRSMHGARMTARGVRCTRCLQHWTRKPLARALDAYREHKCGAIDYTPPSCPTCGDQLCDGDGGVDVTRLADVLGSGEVPDA